jgi:hypothetical protein
MAVASRVVGAGGGDTVSGQSLGHREEAVSGQVVGEDASHDQSRNWIRLELVETLTDRCFARVGMDPGIGDSVAVGWASAKEPALRP